jgi:hypothetical protein
MANKTFEFVLGTAEWAVIIKMDVKNRNIHICDSYQITKTKDMEYILDTIMNKPFYAEMVAAGYNRTKADMMREWKAHNALHKNNVEVDRTKCVDLDFAQGQSFWHRLIYWFLSIFYRG